MPFTASGSFTDLPDWYQAILRSFIEKAASLEQQRYPEYQGERVAPLPPAVLKSYDIAKNTEQYKPYFSQANQLLQESNQPYGKQLEQYSNPYLQSVVENIGKQGKRLFSESILPALEAKFVNLGQHGSSRHKDLSLRAARDLEEAILEKQSGALARGYEQAGNTRNQERLGNLYRAQTLGNLGQNAQGAQQQDVNLLNSLGVQEQAHRQQQLNAGEAEFWRNRLWPQQQLAQQANVVQGFPAPVSGTTGFNYAPPQGIPQVNALGNLGGMAAQLYGLGRQGGFKKGGHVKLSSIRLKKKYKNK